MRHQNSKSIKDYRKAHLYYIFFFGAGLGNATGATQREFGEYEEKITDQRAACEKQEKEVRAAQAICESDLKAIDSNFKGALGTSEKELKELKLKIDRVNEIQKKVVQEFEKEKLIFKKTMENQREYLERLQAGRHSNFDRRYFATFISFNTILYMLKY